LLANIFFSLESNTRHCWKFAILSQREVKIMATATEVIANETEIANAIGVLRLAGLDEDLLNKIEMDRELALSIAEADRGETFPIEQLEKEVMGKFASGYYGRK
jgi:hypothetical protein